MPPMGRAGASSHRLLEGLEPPVPRLTTPPLPPPVEAPGQIQIGPTRPPAIHRTSTGRYEPNGRAETPLRVVRITRDTSTHSSGYPQAIDSGWRHQAVRPFRIIHSLFSTINRRSICLIFQFHSPLQTGGYPHTDRTGCRRSEAPAETPGARSGPQGATRLGRVGRQLSAPPCPGRPTGSGELSPTPFFRPDAFRRLM